MLLQYISVTLPLKPRAKRKETVGKYEHLVNNIETFLPLRLDHSLPPNIPQTKFGKSHSSTTDKKLLLECRPVQNLYLTQQLAALKELCGLIY